MTWKVVVADAKFKIIVATACQQVGKWRSRGKQKEGKAKSLFDPTHGVTKVIWKILFSGRLHSTSNVRKKLQK